MKILLQASMGLILFAMSLVDHAAGGVGIFSLIPMSLLSNQNQSNQSMNAFGSSTLDMALLPRLEEELQKNESLKYFKILDDFKRL